MPRFDVLPEQLTTLPITYSLDAVPDEYLDLMGHTNVQHYGVMFSKGAREFMSLLGVTTEYVKTRRHGVFMLRNFTQYIAEVNAGESLTIRSRLVDYSEKRVHYVCIMVNETRNNIAATFEALSTHADLTARRSSAWPPDLIAIIERYHREHSALTWQPPLSGAIHV